MARAIAIIPARMASSRFPGKPLKPLLGMPLVGHCLERAKLVPEIQEVYLATCDEEIASYGSSIGFTAIMTSASHRRAATRTAEALATIQQLEPARPVEIVLMIQGDEPLIPPGSVSQLIRAFDDPSVSIVNLLSRIEDEAVFRDKNNVKAVISNRGHVLYFSREPIPCAWTNEFIQDPLLQTGVIGFRPETLAEFNSMPETSLEVIESVDMNRVLESGGLVTAVVIDHPTLGVDTAAELTVAESLLANDEHVKRYMAT